MSSGRIGKGACDFENAVVCTRREIHFLHRMFQLAVALGVQLAVLADLSRPHGRVRRVGTLPEPLQLDAAGGDHPLADGFRRFPGISVRGRLAKIH